MGTPTQDESAQHTGGPTPRDAGNSKARRSLNLLTNISTVVMLVFLYVFVSRNAPGLTQLPWIIALAVVYAIIYLAATARFLTALPTELTARQGGWLSRGVLVAGSAGLVYVFLNATVRNYYQPLSLYDEAIGLLALWWVLLIVQNVLALFMPSTIARGAALMTVVALAAWPLAASLKWVNLPAPGAQVTANGAVFIGGEDGYRVYRIPGLAVIPAGATLADGSKLVADRLLAFAEARRDGALDTGVIDLVLKTSDDGGASWSSQAVVCQHRVADSRGKCGNPTPVFDPGSGKLMLAYNLSGPGMERQHSGHIISSDDGGKSWGPARQLTQDNFIFGPGKGLSKTREPHRGRLLLPGYSDGRAQLLISDDQGETWQRDSGMADGDETDVAELADGRIYLATRHRAPIGRAPEPNGRLFSIGNGKGGTWPEAAVSSALPTPVCQASVLAASEGTLLFANPSHPRSRVQMTVRASRDNGESWPLAVMVYPGPAGYSVLGQGSDGDIFLLYENGNMAYSERISLARIGGEQLLRSTREGSRG